VNVLPENTNHRIYKRVHCADGYHVSIQAHYGSYCAPRPGGDAFGMGGAREDYAGPFYKVELGFPSAHDALLNEWGSDPDDPTGTIYGYVPVDVVRELIAKHGGMVKGECPPLSGDQPEKAEGYSVTGGAS
jgi:hypothetical protein